ncbi:MAG: HEAT repeat domain-containing protein [Candidatus Thorarchaeota archaeon]
MGEVTIPRLAHRREYEELEKWADEYIHIKGWKSLLRLLQQPGFKKRSRDAVVSLLQLESVGGTDTDVFTAFADLDGDSLREIRVTAVEHTIGILRGQIENNHTYFLDIEAMTMTPFVVLVKDVIEARKQELEQLKGSPSRLEVLGTYYGFQILITDGSRPHETNRTTGYYRWYRRTWLDEKITDSAAKAVKSLTAELGEEVDMDKTYRTLGSSRVFRERCTRPTADILENAVRLALYKTPGHRASAAKRLGRTGDSRVLPFLHHRLPLEQNMRTRIAIANALGLVGHTSSIELLKERATPRSRYMNKEGLAMVEALGEIYSRQSKEILRELLKNGGNTLKAAAIQALSNQDRTGMLQLLSPYLVHKSRPVVRASVLALAELGDEGESLIRAQAPIVIKRIGYDKPSRQALLKLMTIRGVNRMESVHQYFAKRIENLGREIKSLENRANHGYSYYWRRREARARRRLEDYLRMVNTHLRPPYTEELLKSIRTVTKSEKNAWSAIRQLGEKFLSQLRSRRSDEHDPFMQTRLQSYG